LNTGIIPLSTEVLSSLYVVQRSLKAIWLLTDHCQMWLYLNISAELPCWSSRVMQSMIRAEE